MNVLRSATTVQLVPSTRKTAFGTVGTPCEQPAPASSPYRCPCRNATSATPLTSGTGIGCVWLEGSASTTVETVPSGATFEIRPPRAGSLVLPVYGPTGGITWSHCPAVESVPPRPPSAT